MEKIEQDVIDLLSVKNLTIDEVIKQLNYYSNYSVLNCINKLAQQDKLRFKNSKLVINR